MSTTACAGPGSARRAPAMAAPSAMDQGSGFDNAPLSARAAAARAPPGPAAPPGPPSAAWASAMHSELVMNRSTSSVTTSGPTAPGPSSATSSGTPMKPVLGKAATRAPKLASLRPTRSLRLQLITTNTMSSAAARYTASSTGLSISTMGVLAPKRNSMQGSAKYRTNALSPGMALSGNTWRCAAR